MNDRQERSRPWVIPMFAALMMVVGLAGVAWPGNGVTTIFGGAMVAVLSALALGWAVLTGPTPLRRLTTALLPGVFLALILAVVMSPGAPVDPGGQTVSRTSGTIAAPEVNNLDELYAQALDVADQLADDGSRNLETVRLFTDLRAGSRVEVVDGKDIYSARLETVPQREWQWESRSVDQAPGTFDGREVTLQFDPVIEELTTQSVDVGITPEFETVWIDPGHGPFQPLESANPQALPVLQFNSRIRGREIRAQALGDGTLPGTFFDVRDQEAALQHITDALLLDARGSTTAEFQLITARTPTSLLDGPAIDDRPIDGGVQFLGLVDGDYLEVTVGVGRFPTIRDRTSDDSLGYLPLADVPADALAEVPDSERAVAWQLRAEHSGLRLRVEE